MIDADPTSVAANSYVSLAESIEYLIEGRLFGDAWAAADESTKEKALRWATHLFDSMWAWKGTPLSDDQPLAFPLEHEDIPEGFPPLLRRATAEVAMLLLGSDPVKPLALLQKGFKIAKVDVLGVTLDKTYVPIIFPSSIVVSLETYGTLLNDPTSTTRVIDLERA